jgi:ribose transport system permease protein
MSEAKPRVTAESAHTYLLVPILLLFVLLVIAVLRAPSLMSNVGIGSAIIVASPLILATYALTVIAMAGRAGVDLSIGPLIGFINVGLIQLFAAGVITTPVEFFAYAIAVGVLYQLLMGLIIVYVRVQPIIVALSGFLALVGLNLVILPRPGGLAPDWMMPWGLGETIWSPVLAIVILATGAWFLLTRTAFYGHLRMMGSDERTAYSAGVRINVVRLGAHVIAGIYAALAALTFTSLISSGDPTQGTTYTLMAVTALVLGGTSLAGGRGSVIGSLLGALNIYLITYVLSTFSFGMVQSFVTDAAYGIVLVVSLLLTLVLPRLPAGVRRISPFAFFVVLGILAVGVILYSKDEVIAPDSGIMVLSGDSGGADSGLTVLGGEESGGSDSGLTVLGGDEGASDSSGLTVLGGESDESGFTVLGGEESAAPEASAPKGTPLVYAAIAIAIVVFLFYLVYRHASVPVVAFVGIVVLLVLGLSLHSGPGTPSAGAVGLSGPLPSWDHLFDTMEPLGVLTGGPGHEAALASPLISVILIVAGTILFSSFLMILALPKVRARIPNVPLLFLLALGAVAVAVVVYAQRGTLGLSGQASAEVYALLLLGAVLFVASLPRVQARVRNLPILLFTILSVAALGAVAFMAAPEREAATAAGTGRQAAALSLGAAVQVEPSEALYVAVFCVIAAAAALFIVTMPRLRRHILRYALLEKGVRVFSYTGGFVVGAAILALGAMFYAADLPLWKLGVAIVAATIAARYGWRFLRRYRGPKGLFPAMRDDSRRRTGKGPMVGAER